MIEILGYVAAVITTASFVPQTLKTIRTKNTEGISFYMYFFFLIGIILWMIYGVLINSWPIILANGFTTIMSSIILGYKIKDMRSST